MEKPKIENEIRTLPRKFVYVGSLSLLLASLQMVIFNSYVLIYLEEDLVTSVAIITLIVGLRNFVQIFFRIPLGELSQILGRRPLILFGHLGYTSSIIFLFFASDWILVLIGTLSFHLV